MFDLIIRGGTVVDGTGSAPARVDVAVSGDKIVAIGSTIAGEAKEVIDADGLTITPGFIDVHTHYDGQIWWDPGMDLSAAHGVTTIVIGNCGVGLAPVHPTGRQSLIDIMEGVEEIPSATLNAGVPFSWESFPEFLDQMDERRWAVDVAALVAHGPIREYVMGDRGRTNQPASDREILRMAELVRAAVEAGAFGCSSNRVEGHATRSGRPVAGTHATFAELRAIADAVGLAGGSVFEVAQAGAGGIPREASVLDDLAMLAKVSRDSELPLTFLLLQTRSEPDMWRKQLEFAETENRSGARLVPQVAGRPFGVLIGFPTGNPFVLRPTFHQISKLPLDDMLTKLHQPEIRQAILDEEDVPSLRDARTSYQLKRLLTNFDNLFPLGETLDYEPPAELNVRDQAISTGRDPLEVIYDNCMSPAGSGFMLQPLFNYAAFDHEVLREQLEWPGTLLGLDDGGAHGLTVCDASQPTSMLTHWIRDRTRGPRISLALAVKKLTSEVAEAVGLRDRGVVSVGKRADLNIVDLDALHLEMPRAVDDLPGGSRRLVQDAVGYKMTVLAGVVTRRDDQATGALPGRLTRRVD
jgi:N-acyl-D-aspartate/D-glutamate deacylase